MKLLEHGMKSVGRDACQIVTVNEIQIVIMLDKGKIDAVFIVRRLQEKCHAKGNKSNICFVDLERASGMVPWNAFEWVMLKNYKFIL